MEKDFLKNFQVNGAPLPDAVIDAILQEHAHDLVAAKADTGVNGGTGGKTFSQEDVNRIVSERLARDRADRAAAPSPADEREAALRAREARLDCRDYLDSKKYPAALLDVLDSSDVEKFKAATDTLVKQFPAIARANEIPPPYAFGTGTGGNYGSGGGLIADAFKPPNI